MLILITLVTPCILICVQLQPCIVYIQLFQGQHMFITEPSLLSTCDTLPPLSNYDHQGILMELSQKPVKAERTQGQQIWRYTYADWDKACQLLNEFNQDSILSQDIEKSWKLWHQQFMSIMAQAIPNNYSYEKKHLTSPG